MTVVGLHGPVYIATALLAAAQAELKTLPIRAAVGYEPTALERIAYEVLRANGKLGT